MEEIQDSRQKLHQNEYVEVVALRKQLEEQSQELEIMRKRLNRDSLTESSKSSAPKHESEEIMGLK